MNSKRTLFSYLGITIGSIIMALSIIVFIKSNNIVPGGIMGIVNIINYFTGFSMGLTTLCFSIPVLFIGVLTLGRSVGLKTIYCNLVYAFAVDVFDSIMPLITSDLFLASIFGGALMGIGVGIILGFGGTFGGTDLVSRIIQKLIPSVPIQWIMFTIDFMVILAGGIAFGPELALFSIITVFIMTKVIDMMQEGVNYGKSLFIISEKAEEIADAILKQVDTGLTSISGKGMYTRQGRNILFCVVKRRQVFKVKTKVLAIDPKAFITIGDVREVVGKGFGSSIFSK